MTNLIASALDRAKFLQNGDRFDKQTAGLLVELTDEIKRQRALLTECRDYFRNRNLGPAAELLQAKLEKELK